MILAYSIISSIILGCCFLAYHFFMAGERQHAMNRKILLLIYALSLLLPIGVLAVLMHHPELSHGSANIEIGDITSEFAAGTDKSNLFKSIDYVDLIYKIFIAGLIITAIYYFFGIAILSRIMKKGNRTEFGNFTLILADDSCKISPFSWGNSIVMKNSDYNEDGDMILIHEYAHLKEHHWTDLVLAYTTICLQWYNPAAWAMREELRAIHEYQADESVIESGVDAKDYQMLLLKRAVGYGYQSLANSLNHSKLQKRVTMMYKKKTSLQRKLFALALVPALGVGIAVTAIPSVAGVLESLASVTASKPSDSNEASVPSAERKIYKSTEEIPEFPGGMQALMQFLCTNIHYPEEAVKAKEQGRVIVRFVVNKDGSVTEPIIVRGVSESLDKEAIRVVKSLPKWKPGMVKDQPVDSYFTLPVSFKLQDDTPKEEN